MNKGFKILKIAVAVVLFVLLFGWVTMMLWNWLVPELFNGPEISFLKALGLLLLAKILFGGWGGRRWGNHGMHWKHHYYEKLSRMTPEEREKFKARFRDKWCSKEQGASSENQGTSNV